jgi:hypothetical protein
VGDWEIYLTSEVTAWLESLQAADAKSAVLADDAIYALRPGSSGTSEIRILFVFDPRRSAMLLVAGDKSGKRDRWYAEAIPHAEQLYEIHPKERAEEETRR